MDIPLSLDHLPIVSKLSEFDRAVHAVLNVKKYAKFIGHAVYGGATNGKSVS